MISLRLTASYQSVDATGFEPATSASRTQRSTKLSHASIFMKHFVVSQIVLHYIITSFSVCPEKFCIFLIFLKFQTKPPKIYDIMNSDEFILEVPAELRMRRSRRRKEDIMNSDEFILEVPAELRMRRKQRKKRIYRIHNIT